MTAYLNRIRTPRKRLSVHRDLQNTFFVVLLGLALGALSKLLDCVPRNHLPLPLSYFDVPNFLGRLAIWLLLAVMLSVYSRSPLRAGLHVFLFFAAMLISYYAYTKFIAGFFPKSYILIWAVCTLISPFLAMLCWYAKGNGIPALLLSSMITGVLFLQAFFFGLTYFDVAYQGLEILVWLAAIAVLYKNPRQCLMMVLLSLLFAVVCKLLLFIV